MSDLKDSDPQETREWIEALEAVIEKEGPDRAHYLLEHLIDTARREGSNIPYTANTAYLNTIPVNQETSSPGDPAMEWRIRSFVRWNAMAMVVRANKRLKGLGGHIASFASSATLYDVGFNHFFRPRTTEFGGDLLFVQGHSAPGIYSRAFMYGNLSAEDLDNFRHEANGVKGLPAYPHPHSMPDFWQFPTVSMGLGPLMAIYQARFMKYMANRGLIDQADRKVWAYMGDGEMDEPEAMGAIGLAARENLDNLVFVINCNLQRLDGPVRGNSKIIQELEGTFRGAGWNVIKVIWGAYWDPLLARDTHGLLKQRMEECVDGEYQAYKARDGAYVREHFFGKYPELKAMVANMTDDDIWRLNRGGHDPHKVYAAYDAASKHKGQPTLILVKTVKGYGMGEAGEAQMASHQQKSMDLDELKAFRDRFNIPVTDDEIDNAPYYRPDDDSPEIKYLKQQREKLGGWFFGKRPPAEALPIPDLDTFSNQLQGSGDRQLSSTMAFVRILNTLIKDKALGKHIIPIVADEARTFGMEGMFRSIGIYSALGQVYEPVDRDQMAYYKESTDGQLLEEGINEAGATASWIAAGTSYKNHGIQMVPFYIFYSMFGFQRVGDLAWAAGDIGARGFLIGGTAGRTTLAGEGLQHCDGHSHILSGTIPNCISYDPTYGYELAVIIQHGLKRMTVDQEDVYYYLTTSNENITHQAMPEGAEEGIIKGMHIVQKAKQSKLKVRLLGSGIILEEVRKAAVILFNDYQIDADIWSVTSFTELQREGEDKERWNRLHPNESPQTSYVQQCLNDEDSPIIATTDFMKSYADQIRRYLKAPYTVLGTDGFGCSDGREELRRHFEIDAANIVVASLVSLAQLGQVDHQRAIEAIERFNIDTNAPNPASH